MSDAFRESLLSTHTFPGPYALKIIGRNVPTFLDSVVELLQAELSPQASLTPALKQTPHGRHISATFDLHVESVDQIIHIYTRLRTLDEVVMLL